MFFLILAVFGSALAWGIYRNLNDMRFARAILDSDLRNDDKIDNLVRFFGEQGYVVGNRSANQVQLVRKKRFSFIWALIWLLFFGLGLLVYVLYYLAKRDDVQTFTLPPEAPLKVVSPEAKPGKGNKAKAKSR